VTVTPEELAASIDFLARRFGLSGYRNEATLREAAAEANALTSTDPGAEPAAVFYALARRARPLRDGWALVPDLVALNKARAAGWTFSPEGLRALRLKVATGAAEFPEVAAWFAARKRPI